jgi:hypothetical protein
MIDFSIENASKNIYSKQTKDYFSEVFSSYNNGNNRAAIVTLYSVTISDILIKLEILEEIYADTSAKAILDEVRTFQTANPNSPEWEKDLIEKVKSRTNMIDNVDYAHILSLRNDRHLCAHPVINKDNKLYTPNRETVAAHIRNMLESFLLKPAILSKKILSTILIDIAGKKDILIDEATLERYIKSKYLYNLTPSTEVGIFRDLWKFIYRMNDEQSNDNRLINYRVLYLLFKRNSGACVQKIQGEQEYFSNVLNSAKQLNFLIRFLAENEYLFKDFRDDAQLLISKRTESDANAKGVAWFLSPSYNQHLEILKPLIKDGFPDYTNNFESGALQRLLNIGISKGFITEVVDFIIWRYSSSRNFDDADSIYTYIVQHYFQYYTEENIEKLCKGACKNGQVYSRNRAIEDHENLKKHIESKFDSFNFSRYKELFN